MSSFGLRFPQAASDGSQAAFRMLASVNQWESSNNPPPPVRQPPPPPSGKRAQLLRQCKAGWPCKCRVNKGLQTERYGSELNHQGTAMFPFTRVPQPNESRAWLFS